MVLRYFLVVGGIGCQCKYKWSLHSDYKHNTIVMGSHPDALIMC